MNWLIESLNQAAPHWWAYMVSAAWQSSLVVLALLGLAALLRRRSAPLRYGLLVVALLKFAVPPMAALPVGLLDRVALKVPDTLTAPAARIVERELPVTPSAPGQVLRYEIPQENGNASWRDENHVGVTPGYNAAIVHTVATHAPLHGQVWLMLGYGLGAALLLAWIVGQWVRLERLARRAAVCRETPILEQYLGLARQLGLRRLPSLLILEGPISPIAFGVVRPAVMISRSMIARLTAAELRTILGHELAHHRRLDPLCNWFQLILAAAWWFNPAFWLLSRALRRVREDCCDDLLLVSQLTSSEAYCETILHAGQGLAASVAAGTVLGFAERMHPLHRRLRRIMDGSLRRAGRLSLAGLLLVAIVSAALLPGIRSRAASPAKKAKEPAPAATPALTPTPVPTAASPNASAKAQTSISGTIHLAGKPRQEPVQVMVSTTGRNMRFFSAQVIASGSDDFVIDHLEPGEYNLQFRSSEIEEQTVRGIKAPSSGLKVELQRRPASPRLCGVVLDEATSRPLSRFRVRISLLENLGRGSMGISGKQMEWHDFSNPDGRFELDLFGPGVYRVEADAPGLAPRTRTYNSEIERGKFLKMTLTSGATLYGRVVDEQGHPIAGARVNPLSKAGGHSLEDPDYMIRKEGAVTSRPDGGFEITHLPLGRETVKVEHPDYCFKIVRDIELRGGVGPVETIVLSRGATVQGHVYDANGKPAAGERVGYQDANYGGGSTRPPYFGYAKTDADGFYRVEHLPEQLCYATRGMLAEGVEGQTILPSAITTLTLDLGGKNRVFGRLVDGGKPVAGCRVVVANFPGQSFQANVKTDAQGAFSFYGIPPGRRTLYAEDIDRYRGGATRLKEIEITPDMVEKGTALDLGNVTRPRGRVVIKVEDPQQRPPDRLRVSLLYPRTDPSMPTFGTGQAENRGTTEYVVADLMPGQYRATVGAKSGGFGYGRLFELKEGQAEARVTVAMPTGTAVVQGKYSLPPNQTAILIRSDRGLSAYITPRGQSYRIENLPAGEYLLFDENLRSLAPLKRIKVGEGETVTQDIGGPEWDKLAIGFLSVNVFTESGRPLPGAGLWLERQGSTLKPAGVYDYKQNFAGEPGEYILHAVYPGYKEVRQAVTLRAVSADAFHSGTFPEGKGKLPTILIRLERER